MEALPLSNGQQVAVSAFKQKSEPMILVTPLNSVSTCHASDCVPEYVGSWKL